MAALLAVAGAGMYLQLGAPGASDAPLGPRLEDMRRAAAERPTQEAAESLIAQNDLAPPPVPGPEEAQMRAMIDRLRLVLADRPDDLRGRRLLVQALMRMDDTAGAWRAQEQVLTLLGAEATAEDYALSAEAMILAVRGYVSPQAEAQLTRALAIDPAHPTARYYAGLSLAQNGRPDLTLDLWTPLLAEGPPDAPWKEPILTMIGGVAAEAGKPVPEVASSAADALRAARAQGAQDAAQAAESMSPEDRREMIETMIGQLENKLATTGGGPEDWARLIQAYGVLGRPDDVARVLGSAREAFAAAPGVLEQLEAVAAQTAAPALPGPDAEALRDAETMAPDDRAAMISGMVARLADRLAQDGGTAPEWVRLIRAYGVTGDRDAGIAARDAALAAHGADPEARAQIEAAAATLPAEAAQ
jgi:cytochrome c-type biogenesis protein CcmH